MIVEEIRLRVEHVGRVEENLYGELRDIIEVDHKLPSQRVGQPREALDWLESHGKTLSDHDVFQLERAFEEHVGAIFHVDLEDKFVYLNIYEPYTLDDD